MNKQLTDKTLINFGGAVKALGNGKFEGHLVSFGHADQTDLAGDFFTKSTDFWTEFPKTVPLIYAHGMDDTLKTARLPGGAALELKDSGVWLQGQLNMADEYQAAIYGLIEQGKMGLSSGSASHLVEREETTKSQSSKAQGAKAFEIKSWPIVEASLTPQPCEPRNFVAPLKSAASIIPTLLGPNKDAAVKSKYLGANVEGEITYAAIDRLNDRLMYSVVRPILCGDEWDLRYGPLAQFGWDEDTPVAERIPVMTAAFDEYRDLSVKIVEAILGETGDETAEEAGAAIKSLVPNPDSSPVDSAAMPLERQMAQALAATKSLVKRAETVHALRVKSGRVLSASNRSRLEEHLTALTAASSTVQSLLDESTPPTDPPAADETKSVSEQATAAYGQMLAAQARSLGVHV